MKALRLILTLGQINSGSYQELENELGQYPEISGVGLDNSTQELRMIYYPEMISQDFIIDKVEQLGYQIIHISESRPRIDWSWLVIW